MSSVSPALTSWYGNDDEDEDEDDNDGTAAPPTAPNPYRAQSVAHRRMAATNTLWRADLRSYVGPFFDGRRWRRFVYCRNCSRRHRHHTTFCSKPPLPPFPASPFQAAI